MGSIPLKDVFNVYLIIIQASIGYLKEKYSSDNVDDIKSYQVIILNRILQSMSTIEVILSHIKDPISSYGLLRMIIDSICSYCFIYDNDNIEEVKFRHYLYLLDGCSRYNELCTVDITDNTIKPESDNNKYTEAQKQTSGIMNNFQDGIRELLNKHPYKTENSFVAEKIIKAKEWKYKTIDSDDSKNYYDWQGLYEKVGCSNQMSRFISKFLSQYVHGLFLSNTRNPTAVVHYQLIYGVLVTFIEKMVNVVFRVFNEDNLFDKTMEKIDFCDIVNNESLQRGEILNYLVERVKPY